MQYVKLIVFTRLNLFLDTAYLYLRVLFALCFVAALLQPVSWQINFASVVCLHVIDEACSRQRQSSQWSIIVKVQRRTRKLRQKPGNAWHTVPIHIRAESFQARNCQLFWQKKKVKTKWTVKIFQTLKCVKSSQTIPLPNLLNWKRNFAAFPPYQELTPRFYSNCCCLHCSGIFW